MTERLDQRGRLVIAALLGLVVGLVTALFCPWQLSVLAGWDTAALFIVGSVWTFIPRLDATATQRLATREDDSHALLDVAVLIACLASLVGVIAGLAYAEHHEGPVAVVLGILSGFTILLSWFTVHTLFALRYARLYYNDPRGGIEFAAPDETPDYLDFVYVAFTVGMTFQVSDTNIGQRLIRRTVIRHSLLSYAFGTAIVGVAINVVGNLIGG
jgi:uncharacterized membrane protein